MGINSVGNIDQTTLRHVPTPQETPHNLGLYRLHGFCGRQEQLLTLHEWLTGDNLLPAMWIQGERGVGKSTLATAVAWNLYYHFSDGIIWVSTPGVNPFRIYDIVRTFDTVLGTTLTRVSEDRWGISILEQLYGRRRLLIVDKLTGASTQEVNALINIISHLHDSGGTSRILLIGRMQNNDKIRELVQHQYLYLDGLERDYLSNFIHNQAPPAIIEQALAHQEQLYAYTKGSPLILRLLLGLMLDIAWSELPAVLSNFLLSEDEYHALTPQDRFLRTYQPTPYGLLDVVALVGFIVQQCTVHHPQSGLLLNRMVRASGGASVDAIHELFGVDLFEQADTQDASLDETIEALKTRSLLEFDIYRQRLMLHPLIRRYVEQYEHTLSETWDRRHATYYVQHGQRYENLPLERWREIDVDWGNIYTGADWCARLIEQLGGGDVYSLLVEIEKEYDTVDDMFVEPVTENQPDSETINTTRLSPKDDYRLVRSYGLAIAHYAFWRHPLGSMRWIAAGAVASYALYDLRNYGWLIMAIGRYLFFLGRVEEALDWFYRARDVFDKQDLIEELAHTYTDLGTAMRVLDQPSQAVIYFQSAFEFAAQVGEPKALATTYMNLGSAYYTLQDYIQAYTEHTKALRIARRLHNERLVASAYNNMGLALEGQELYTDAQQMYLQALQSFQRIHDSVGISTCYNNLGSVGYALGEFSEALKWYELDLQISQERSAWTDTAATLHNLGHVALEQEVRDKAINYFEQSRDLYAAFELDDYVAEEVAMIEYIHSLE